ncbi:hypothetical protein [Bradyrhizobium sp. ORS 86]|uniref:hypothetical protein n=1 Tax=Bradyrhizobium sp. ORS 86 TaxID=1685970 RepID=UPI00388EF91E
MITSFEVGAVFKILDQASPALRKMLATIRELNKQIAEAKLAIKGFADTPALATAISETKLLADEWKNVAKSATAANRAIGRATGRQATLAGPGAAAVAETQAMANAWTQLATSMTAVRAAGRRALPPPPGMPTAPGGGGGGGRHRPRFLAGNSHVGGPSLALAGGSHVSFRGGAAAATGLLGYGAYEAAQMEDAVFQLIYHSGLEQNDSNRSRFRKILQDSMAESGYSLHDVAESAKQEIRMFQGTPGGGIEVLPEMLRAATIESRLKGESPEESMKALIGLAHMTKQYDPEAIKKLAPAFAFLSTANPSSLGSIERAAGYAVPILQSSLEIDPMQTLLLGTALTRAGATSTKSGTWLREMALRAMPGTAIFESEKKAEHHDELLKRLGLLDDKGKPLWFTNGRPDIFKLLETAGTNLEKIPLAERAGVERKLFGAQGSGGLALLTDPAVREQIAALSKEMNSAEFKNRYGGFVQAYQQGSTVQQARTAMAEFNITLMDIGAHVLPGVNGALRDFKGVLQSIRDVIPGAKGGDTSSTVLKRGMEGAAIGAGWGLFGGPGGVAGGAAIGGVAGVAAGFMESYAKEQAKTQDSKTTEDFVEALKRANQGAVLGAPGVAPQASRPISLSLNIDGRTLAQAVSDVLQSYYTFATQAPGADGTGQYYSGDHNFPSK